MIIYCGGHPIELGYISTRSERPFFLSMVDKRADGSHFVHSIRMEVDDLLEVGVLRKMRFRSMLNWDPRFPFYELAERVRNTVPRELLRIPLYEIS